MVGEIDEERIAAVLLDEGECLVGEPVGELFAVGVEVGVLREAEVLRKHDRVEALAARSDRAGAAAAEVPHPEERGRITSALQRLRERDHVGGQFGFAVGRLELVPG